MGRYIRPTELSEALATLREGAFEIVAGGTDYYPARVGRALDDDVLDITSIDGLRGIEDRGDHIHIGALATWSDLIRTPLPPAFDGLKLAARELGGVQIQNAGTICGNVCNASPAADGVPPLLALDAEIDLAATAGSRSMALSDFVVGNRETARRPDEMVTGIRMPMPAESARGTFLKLGARRYLVISIVMVSAVLEPGPKGAVAGARVAVGACSAAARRLPELERDLAGAPLDRHLGDLATPAHLASLTPIDDIRGPGAYRLDAALTLVRRALARLGAEPGET